MVFNQKNRFKLVKDKTSSGKTIYKIVNKKTGRTKEVDGVIAYRIKRRALANLKRVNT